MNFEKINQLITNKVLVIIALVLWGSVALGAIWFEGKEVASRSLKLNIFVITMVIIGIVIIFLLQRFFTIKQAMLIVLVASFIIKLIWVLRIDTQPTSDFLVLHNAALKAASGDFSFMKNNYFLNWPYQLGFVLYEAGIIRVFGTSVMIIKFINIILSLFIALIIYLLGKQSFNQKIGLIGLTLVAFYPPFIFYTNVLTNQYIATLFFYIGFYLLIKYDTWGMVFCSGLFLGLGNIVRPLGPFIILAVLLFIIFYKNHAKYHSHWLTKLILIIAILSGYQLVVSGVNVSVQATQISQYKLENRSNTWKFVTGLNYEANGMYSNKDLQLLDKYPIGRQRDKVGRKIIKERLSDKTQLMKLFVKKSFIMWSYQDSALSWSGARQKVTEKNYQVLLAVQMLFYTLMICLSVVGVFRLLFQKRQSGQLFMILMIGYFLVHLLIEIQTRYRFFIVPTLLLFSAIELNSILSRNNRKRGSISNEGEN